MAPTAIGGEAAFASIDPADRDRHLGNGEVFLHVEMPRFLADQLAAEAIADAPAPIVTDSLRPLLRALS